MGASVDTGHPWEDAELFALRRQQRRTLRALPSWFVEGQAMGLPPLADVADADQAFVEVMLRERAQTLRAELASELVRYDENERRLALERLYRPVNGERRDEYEAVGHALLETLPGEPAGVGRIPDTLLQSFLELLMLLVWADRLAGDGYADPRLSTAG